jgi:hypothetical protein
VAGGEFGTAGLQLVLLRRMADHQPGLVEDALRELGVDRAAMREANRRWQATLRAKGFPQGERRLRILLGPPVAQARRPWGDVTCRVLWWRVPLWPTLRFEALVGPGGLVWNEWLVRAAGARGPELTDPDALVPWSCTVDEVARAFPPARPMPGDAPTRWRLAFGPGHVAHFTYGLLQYVDRPHVERPTP